MTLSEAQHLIGETRYIPPHDDQPGFLVRCKGLREGLARSTAQPAGVSLGGPYRPVEPEPTLEVFVGWTSEGLGFRVGRTRLTRWVGLARTREEYLQGLAPELRRGSRDAHEEGAREVNRLLALDGLGPMSPEQAARAGHRG